MTDQDTREKLATRYLREAHFYGRLGLKPQAVTWIHAAAMALNLSLPEGFAGLLATELPDGRPLRSVSEAAYAELAATAIKDA